MVTKKAAKKAPAKKTAKDFAGKVVKAVKKAVEPAPPKPPVLPPDAHAEAVFAADDKNKDFVAVASDDISRELSVSVVAEQAWNNIKDSADPLWHQCVTTHRDRFLSEARGILRGQNAQEGDAPIARFGREVQRLAKENN